MTRFPNESRGTADNNRKIEGSKEEMQKRAGRPRIFIKCCAPVGYESSDVWAMAKCVPLGWEE